MLNAWRTPWNISLLPVMVLRKMNYWKFFLKTRL